MTEILFVIWLYFPSDGWFYQGISNSMQANCYRIRDQDFKIFERSNKTARLKITGVMCLPKGVWPQ